MLKFTGLASAALLAFVAAPASAQSQPISADAIREDVRTLSSDAFQGRGPGERGETMTLAYTLSRESMAEASIRLKSEGFLLKTDSKAPRTAPPRR